MTTSIDTEQAFNKIQDKIMIKPLEKLAVEDN